MIVILFFRILNLFFVVKVQHRNVCTLLTHPIQFIFTCITNILYTFYLSHQNNLKRTLSQVKVEHGYVGKSVNTEFDENQNKANLDIGVLVTVEKSNSASNSGQKSYFDESVEKKENYEVILFGVFFSSFLNF